MDVAASQSLNYSGRDSLKNKIKQSKCSYDSLFFFFFFFYFYFLQLYWRRNDRMAYPLGARSAHLASSARCLNRVSVRNSRSMSLPERKRNFRTIVWGPNRSGVKLGHSQSSTLVLETGGEHVSTSTHWSQRWWRLVQCSFREEINAGIGLL